MPATTPYRKKSYHSMVAPTRADTTTLRIAFSSLALMFVSDEVCCRGGLGALCGSLRPSGLALEKLGHGGGGHRVQPGVRPDEVDGLLGHHHGGCVGVARHQRGHGRAIDHA